MELAKLCFLGGVPFTLVNMKLLGLEHAPEIVEIEEVTVFKGSGRFKGTDIFTLLWFELLKLEPVFREETEVVEPFVIPKVLWAVVKVGVELSEHLVNELS